MRNFNLDFDQNEVIVALTKPTGTDINNFKNRLEEAFSKVQANIVFIDLVDVLEMLNKRNSTVKNRIFSPINSHIEKYKNKNLEFMNTSKKMSFGNLLREYICPEFFSLFGMYSIHNYRTKMVSKNNSTKNTVFVLDCLKHPSEEKILRSVYGDIFFLLGISSVKSSRLKYLVSQKGMTSEEATELIERDENEKQNKYGQKMLDVFEKADYFFDETATQNQIDRFVEIILGNNKITPHKDEYYMQMAASVASMSGDLSRQVGAVLVSENGELLSVGYNEVPKFGGGQYSAGETPDYRDLILGYDPNHRNRDLILEAIKSAALLPFQKKTNSQKANNLKNDIEIKLKLPMEKIKNLIEYHRTVHAEMEAIISCARKGLNTKNSVIYTTTYPCHNCAKHLVNAGVKKVIYIESYPKSLATELHGDSIVALEESSDKMKIIGFEGVSPRRYLDFFSQTLTPGTVMDRKGKGNLDGKAWNVSKFPVDSFEFKFLFRLKNVRALEAQVTEFLTPFVSNSAKKATPQLKNSKKSNAA